MIGSVELHPSAAGGVEITDLKVEQEHRRKGVGRELMTAALQTARSQGLGPAPLEARPSDGGISPEALVSMYRSFGFRTLGISSRGNPLMGTTTTTAPTPIDQSNGPIQRRSGVVSQGNTHAASGNPVPIIPPSPCLGGSIQRMQKEAPLTLGLKKGVTLGKLEISLRQIKANGHELPRPSHSMTWSYKDWETWVKQKLPKQNTAPVTVSIDMTTLPGQLVEYKKQVEVKADYTSSPMIYTPSAMTALPGHHPWLYNHDRGAAARQ